MDKEKKAGLMDLYMKVNIWQVKNMDLVFTIGLTDRDILANGMKIKSKVLVLTVG
jgi:hypothetical protein